MSSVPSGCCIAIDVETTGLSPLYGARIIEIGAVALENNRIVAEFHSLINIGKPVPREVTKIHGITTGMLTGKPTPIEILPKFHAFIKGSTLIAHNARFDINFLRHELSLLNLVLTNPYLCTLQLSRKNLKELPNHRLATVAGNLLGGLPHDSKLHRALADARLVAKIWIEMERRNLK